MNYCFKTSGTCSTKINIDISNDGKINDVDFVGGCPGNLIGISQLVKGMDSKEVIARFKGIKCGTKCTSCPDQLSIALEKITKDKLC